MEELRRALSDVDKNNPVACHSQISDLIRTAVSSGDLEAGTRLPSERELVALCGVSRSTIRIALDRLVHEGVIDKRPGKGIFVGPLLHQTIGCVAPVSSEQTRYPWPLVLSQAMTEEVRRRGHEPCVYLLGSDHDMERLMTDVREGHLAGLMSMVPIPGLPEGMPIVLAYGEGPGPGCFIDYVDLGYQGTSLLAREGRRRISLVMYGGEDSASRGALQGYRRALSEHGLSGSECSVPAVGSGEEGGVAGIEALLGQSFDPDGIVFIDDFYALGGMKALAARGVAMPAEVMVATHINTGYTLPYPAPVVRLEVDPAAIAAQLLTLLEAWLDGRPPARRILGVGVHVRSPDLT